MVFNVTRNTHQPTSGSHYPHPDPQAIINNSTMTSPPAEIHITPDNNNTTTNNNYGSVTTNTGNVHNTYSSNDSVHNSGQYLAGSARPSTAVGSGYGTGYGAGPGGHGDEGFPKTIVTLQPIATPQALGLAAWSSAMFVFSSYLADWYGTAATAHVIWPFILTFGGLGQFAAGMWSFNARDTLNSALHTMWGCFWLSVGVYFAYETIIPNNALGRIDAFAVWQVPIGVFTWTACIASLFRDWSLMVILLLQAVGSTLTVIGWFASSTGCLKAAAYFWLAACLGMWYRVTAHFFADSSKRDNLLPVWRRKSRAGRGRNPLENEHCDHQWVPPYREAGVVQGEW